MKGRILLPALACAGILLSCANAFADSEVLLRQEIAFDACHKSVDGILKSINPVKQQVTTEVDTGAMLRIRVMASASDLVMMCNKVTEQIEVTRETPGRLATAD